MDNSTNGVKVNRIMSGKLRRYTNFRFTDYLCHPTIIIRNIIDAFLVFLGTIQSFVKLVIWRPDVAFLKGGYVCLPIGIALHILRIPFVIHDSDATPGLTNRILSRWAIKIATGMPLDNYSYQRSKATYVGIPISTAYSPISPSAQSKLKNKLGFNSNLPLVTITGGGLGSKRINDTVMNNLPDLLDITQVALISGKDQYGELKDQSNSFPDSFKLYDFPVGDMSNLLSAADLVVSRAGATAMAELAALAKPTILVPNAKLPGKHQVKNAETFSSKKATIILDDEDINSNPENLYHAIKDTLSNTRLLDELSNNIHSFAMPHAAIEVAGLVLSCAKKRR